MNPKTQTILARLRKVKASGKGWIACCPAHEDTNPSLSISECDDGKILLKCHAGCKAESIVEVLGMTMSDLFFELISSKTVSFAGPRQKPQQKSPVQELVFASEEEALNNIRSRHGNPTYKWFYETQDGDILGYVLRFEQYDPTTHETRKTFRPISRYPEGWRIAAMPEPRPLFHLTELAEAKRVIVVEGEKCANATRSLGLVATTSVGGSQAAHKTDWSPLAGKEIWILPDNDAPGRKYADTVANILLGLTPTPVVKILELPDLPEAGDIVNWIAYHGRMAEPKEMRAELEALANKVGPETLDPLVNDVGQFRSFPVEALPEPVRSFVVAGAMAIGCDPCYLALPLLTAIAAAIGNTRRLELKRGWLVPPILWSVIVGESGTTKSPAFKLVMRPIRDRQRKALENHTTEMMEYEANLAVWEQESRRLKNSASDLPEKPKEPQAERYSVSDATVESLAPILAVNPRGVLLSRDELAGWIGSFDRYAGKGKTGTDSSNWLSMFNAEEIIVDRKTGSPRTIHVPQAAVCITGGIQPAILQRALGQQHRESGLAARLLLAYPPRQAKHWTEDDIDPNAEAELYSLFGRLYDLQPMHGYDGNPKPFIVQLNPEAKAAWINYYNTHANEQSELAGDLAAAWSKLEEYAARLALVIHVVRFVAEEKNSIRPDVMDADSMVAGIILARWFKHEAKRIYALLDETDVERDERKLVDWIARKGGSASLREVQQGCRWLREPGVAEIALEELVVAGRGKWREAPLMASVGRPSRIFELSTRQHVYEIPTELERLGENRNFVDVDSVDTTRTC